MKRIFILLFSLVTLFLLSSCSELSTTDAIQKIEFYHWWIDGEENRVLLGSTENDYIFKNAWFDMAVYSEEPLETMDIKLTIDNGITKAVSDNNYNFNDYEVQRRRYSKFGYYVINVNLEHYLNSDFNLTIDLSGETSAGKSYSYSYTSKAELRNY